MLEKNIGEAEALIEKIVDREHDHSDLLARKLLRQKLNKKPLGELKEIWEHGEDA